MITEWLVGMVEDLLIFIANLMPSWSPGEMAGARSTLMGLLETFGGFGVWIDWTLLGVCMAAVVGAWAVAVGTKLIRALLAHVPQFGGSGD